MGKALYCSLECRDSAYAEQRRKRAKQRVRQKDGTFKWVAAPSVAANYAEASQQAVELRRLA